MQRLIVVGASAGGVHALRALASGLPAALPCAVMAVLHVGPHPSVLPELLTQSGPLPAAHARHGEPIRPGRIYVAPPDQHMLAVAGTIELTRGPKEHHSRPAIDPLFVSAALSHGPAALGVLLTGMLDDGTAGLQAIKRCGGTALVQDPREAFAPSMPASALRHVATDHCVPLAEMGPLLGRLAAQPLPIDERPRPPQLLRELALMRHEGVALNELQALGEPSGFVCPECHGSLWALQGSRPERFRCHTGHAYTLRTLQSSLSLTTDEAMWNALRALQEKQQVLERLAASVQQGVERGDAHRIGHAAAEVRAQVDALRALIEQAPETIE
jgi:two-component system, chemotaxis family, protein-glutamate methylesterase/glutaminase